MSTASAVRVRRVESGISRTLTLLFAVAGGAAVGSLYWAQPLLADIAHSLHISSGAAGLLVTLTQAGYAVGVFLLVPLGDTLNRRRLIPAVMAGSAIALLASALAPSFAVLLAALAAVGMTTVTGQLLIPLAGDLAHDHERGRVVGIVASGILIGILASRTISGLVAHAFGWRAIYFAAAVVTFALACLLARALPQIPARPRVAYGALLRSVFSTVRAHRPVQITLVLGSTVFCVFTMFWTALTFLLSEAPFSYSVRGIGLVGLAGLAGALAAQRAGRLHDRGWSVPATGGALLLTGVSLLLADLGKHSIVVLVIAIVLLDVAIQSINILNQTRIFAVAPAARSRLNTAFVVCNFVGGAIGSTLAGILWQNGGWSSVTLTAAVLIALALVTWLVARKALAVRTSAGAQTTRTAPSSETDAAPRRRIRPGALRSRPAAGLAQRGHNPIRKVSNEGSNTMSVALQLDYHTLTLDDYRTAGQALDFPADWPAGMLFHDSAEVDGKVRVYEVWETREQFDRYIAENFPSKVAPALGDRADAPEITQIELNTAYLRP